MPGAFSDLPGVLLADPARQKAWADEKPLRATLSAAAAAEIVACHPATLDTPEASGPRRMVQQDGTGVHPHLHSVQKPPFRLQEPRESTGQRGPRPQARHPQPQPSRHPVVQDLDRHAPSPRSPRGQTNPPRITPV